MKKQNLLLTVMLIGLTFLSCSSDDDSNNLNCQIKEIVEPNNFGITESEMINLFSIPVNSTEQINAYRFDFTSEIPNERKRTYWTRNLPRIYDENLEKYFFACFITYQPNENNFQCLKNWLEEKYGVPDFISENNTDNNYFYFKWYFDLPDASGNHKKFISLFRESNDQETETVYLRIDYVDETSLTE